MFRPKGGGSDVVAFFMPELSSMNRTIGAVKM